MVLLLAILMPFTIIGSESTAKRENPKLYYSLLFLLAFSVFGIFLSQDLILFFLFWELELLPVYLLISVWGGKNRKSAANKFLLFTFFGGALVLLGIASLFVLSGQQTFSMLEIGALMRDAQSSSGHLHSNLLLLNIVFLLFMTGFCVKLPSFPLHSWLPEAHVEAPTPISMLLAGILLKMGSYGIIRFSTEVFPESLKYFSLPLAILGVVNIVLAAIFAFSQKDMKRVIAYSSISHMGFVLLGLATLGSAGINGAIFQSFSHGIISAGLFMAIGVIYERTHTRQIDEIKGLAPFMPILFFLFLGLGMANLGLPSMSGFIGESMVFYGAFLTGTLTFGTMQIIALIGTLGLIITTAYMLWLGKRIFFGETCLINGQNPEKFEKTRKSEIFVLSGLLCLSLLFGCLPSILNSRLEKSIKFETECLKGY